MPLAITPLTAFLQAEIRRRGPIPFCEFMEAALYHPALGYYASGKAAIGREGDFFTNVSVGPLFGRLLARQFVEMWRALGEPESWSIIEQGAHRGDFAADALAELRDCAQPCFQALRYRIVEPFDSPRAVQEERLAAFSGKVAWHRSLREVKPGAAVHFSNELLDAFPVHRVAFREGGWVERHVAMEEDAFVYTDAPLAANGLRERLDGLNPVVGFETEVNLASTDWLREATPAVERGFLLAIDYGFCHDEYYRAERSQGTLTGYAGHRRQSDLLAAPGAIDLTAHVDFTSVVDEAESLGWELRGYTDQHHLMVGLSQIYFGPDDPLTPERERELRAFKTLMHPDLMGRSFKALCLSRGVAACSTLSGFQFARASRETLGLRPV